MREVVEVGLILPRTGRPPKIPVAEVVRFSQHTFAEIRSAAAQTNLPIAAYVQEVVEADLASRRLANPLSQQREGATTILGR